MQTYLGIILGSEGFGLPQNLEVQVVGSGKFFEIALRIRDFVADELSGLYLAKTAYSGGFQHGSNETHYAKNPDLGHIAHEEFHKKFATTEYDNEDNYNGLAYTYFKILDESFTKAVEYDVLIDATDEKGDEKWIKGLEYTINNMTNWGSQCYQLCQQISKSKNKNEYKEDVNNLMKKSFCKHEDYNWLTLTMETKYFGLFGACFDLIRGQENFEEHLNYLCEMLLYDETGKEFIDYLQEYTEGTIGDVGVLFEKIVQKSCLHYKNETDKLNLIFIAPYEYDVSYLRETEDKVIKKFGTKIEDIGDLTMRIWGKKVITHV